jgi:hypothetical protein
MAEPRFVYTNLGLEPEMTKLIDDYRFRQRIPARSAAIRELIEIGLAVQGVVPSDRDIPTEPPFPRAIPVIKDGKLVDWQRGL